MTSTPSTEPGAARPRPPRQPRGYVASYGEGRICADLGCRTTLSRYNKSELCWQHVDEIATKRRLGQW